MQRPAEEPTTSVPHQSSGTVRADARAAGVVGVGMLGMNALSYLFTLLSAHLLGPAAFGGVTALLGILIIANVGSLALQATSARRLAVTERGSIAAVTQDLMHSAWRVGAAFGLVLLALSPLINHLLHLHDLFSAALVAVACVPLTLMGAYAGIVQGERRWVPLAAIFISMGLGRVVCGTVALLVSPTLRSAMVGIAVGSVVPALVGWWATRWHPPSTSTATHAPVLRELWRNGHMLLVFFVLTNIDVLLARHLLSSFDAGIYAAGAIVAKTCLFLPGFVVVAAFPRMAARRVGRPWVRPLMAVAVLGGSVCVAVAVFPDLAVAFAGGSEYEDMGNVAWLFAVEGTVFACLQLLVYEAIAAQRHQAALLWCGVAALTATSLAVVTTVTGLVVLVIVVAGTLAVLITALTVRATGRRLAAPVPVAGAPSKDSR